MHFWGGWSETEEELKSLLMRVKEMSEEACLKLSIKKTKIMTSSLITSWQIEGKKWKQWQILLGSKTTVDGDCSHEIKRCLPLGRKAMTNIDSILKRDVALQKKKNPYSQSYRFSSSHVSMWELDWKEDWVPKNWCFWIVVLEKTLGSPLDSKGDPTSES